MLKPNLMDRVYLNVGCGRVKLQGFVNVDLDPDADLQLDVRQGLPYADDSVHGIYSEHFIEHLSQGEATAFLRECRRVLAPGGLLRVATPDLDQVIAEYATHNWRQPWMEQYGYQWISTRAEALNVQMREWGHQWLFNEEELGRLAEFAGLGEGRRCALNESQDAMLAGRETRPESALILEFAKLDEFLPENPLVSIVMPAYKVAHFAQALQSALAQTYDNVEILVLDDSDGTEIEATVRAAQGRPMRYLRNLPRLGEIKSLTRGIELAQGELIKPLYDDDLLEPDCVRRLVAALLLCPRACLATSRRTLIDVAGRTFHDVPFSLPITPADSEIDGVTLAQEVLHKGLNQIGEPSTVLFRRSHALAIRPVVMSFSGIPVNGCGDVALYLNLMSRGNVVYLTQRLSHFRLHAGQVQRDPQTHAAGLQSWIFLRAQAQRLGLYRPDVTLPLRARGLGDTEWTAAGAMQLSQSQPHVLAGSQEQQTPVCFAAQANNPDQTARHACIVHLYHDDLFEEIAPYLDNLPDPSDLFFSVQQSRFDAVARTILSKYPQAKISAFENRGRDILPFLLTLRQIIDSGYQAICKIHTKKSLHYGLHGDRWRKELLQGLLGDRIAVARCLRKIRNGAGIVAPWDCLVQGAEFLGSSEAHYARLAHGMGQAEPGNAAPKYPAGSMFWFKPAALRPLHSMYLQADDFEPETGQIDGTMAHAIERAFGLSCALAGYAVDGNTDPFTGLVLERQTQAAQRWFANRMHAPAAAQEIQVLIGSAVQAPLIEATLASLDAQIAAPAALLRTASVHDFKPTLSAAGATWTLLLAAGDTLNQTALAVLQASIKDKADAATRIVYFDHDELDGDGVPQNPVLKPDFNHELLLSTPYMGRVLLVRTQWLLAQLDAPCNTELELAYRLALACAREIGAAGFVHIPMLLAHLTPTAPSAFMVDSAGWKRLAEELAAHLRVSEPGSQVLEGPAPGTFNVIPPLPHTPLVSIVVPTKDHLPLLSRCIQSLLDNTNYPAFEVLIVDNDSQEPDAQAFLAGIEALNSEQLRVLRAPGRFNFSRMNNQAVAQARGEFILLLNNDTAAIQADWLQHMVRQALRPGVGVVGARLLYPEGTVQHAGIIMGLRGPADHPGLGLPASEPGYMMRAQLTQNFSAVTAACLLVSKAVYEEVGGLDEQDFAVSYNDVDYCLRVGQTGRRIVWTPLATLLHEGSASQKASIENLSQANKVARFGAEQAAMYRRWPAVIASDPAYNPNLSLVERGYEVETNSLLCFDPMRDAYAHKVIAFAADDMGCGHYRMLQPMQAMLQDDLCLGGVSPEIFGPNLALRSQADVLVFQRPNTDQGIQTLESLIPLKGIKKIYEVDDNLSRVPIASAHHQDMPKDMHKRMLKSIGLCDRLVVSTAPLAQAFKHAHDDIRVVPNRLPPAMWGELAPKRSTAQRSPGHKPVVAWAGGVGHGGDLQMVAQVIKELAEVVDWAFFGMCPDAIRPYVRRFYAGVPTLAYPARLMELAQDWDLAIAPLEVNDFNESKSNLRLLEYGWCGLPVVCSGVTPYQDPAFPVTRVKNRHKDWKNAILEKVGDLDAAQKEGLALQALVQRDWVLKGEHVEQWYRAWTD